VLSLLLVLSVANGRWPDNVRAADETPAVSMTVNLNEYALLSPSSGYAWRGDVTLTGTIPKAQLTADFITCYIDGYVLPIFLIERPDLTDTGSGYSFQKVLNTADYPEGYHTLRIYDGGPSEQNVEPTSGTATPTVGATTPTNAATPTAGATTPTNAATPTVGVVTPTSIPDAPEGPAEDDGDSGTTGSAGLLWEVEAYFTQSGYATIVNVGTFCNMRKDPSAYSTLLTTIKLRETVDVLGKVTGQYVTEYKTDVWYHIIYTAPGGTVYDGYVLSSFVSINAVSMMRFGSDGAWIEDFSPSKKSYAFSLPFASSVFRIDSLVRFYPEDVLSVILNGNSVSAPYQHLPLVAGDNQIEITVTRGTGSSAVSTSYTFAISRIGGDRSRISGSSGDVSGKLQAGPHDSAQPIPELAFYTVRYRDCLERRHCQ
jgi:hypothetical protein